MVLRWDDGVDKENSVEMETAAGIRFDQNSAGLRNFVDAVVLAVTADAVVLAVTADAVVLALAAAEVDVATSSGDREKVRRSQVECWGCWLNGNRNPYCFSMRRSSDAYFWFVF